MLKIRPRSFIPFVTAGYPDLETSRQVIVALAELGAAAVEIGIPFSDPVADGPIIQRSSFAALSQGYRMSDYLQLVRDVRERSGVGLVFMTYLNPVLQYGLARLDADGAAAGLDGILISDLTPEEYLGASVAGTAESEVPGIGSFSHTDRREDAPTAGGEEARSASSPLHTFKRLQTIFLVAPTSSESRVELVCRASTGFVYLIARTGVTGRQTEFSELLPGMVARIRRYTDVPVAVGFGVRTRSDLERVWQFADGAIVGSAIVEFMENHRSQPGLAARVADFVRETLLPEPEGGRAGGRSSGFR